MTLRPVSRKVQPLLGSARPFWEKGIEEHDETIMLHVNTKDNENGRRRRDRPLGLSNRKGTNLKVCPYIVVFGGDFQVKLNEIKDATPDELSQREDELRKELFNLRFQKVISGLENPMRMSQVRKEIARIKTIMNGR